MHPGVVKEVIRIIEADTHKKVKNLNPRGGFTCGMAFSPDSQQLLIANWRGAHLYDTNSWEATRLILE
jgi:hypothetical protein